MRNKTLIFISSLMVLSFYGECFIYICKNKQTILRSTASYKMDSTQFTGNICRICLDDNVYLDWNTTLYQFYETTYRDCYYKYTQLDSDATAPLTQMLCQNCSIALESTHALILKALDSHKLLQDRLSFNGYMIDELRTSPSNSQFDYMNITPTEFETVLVEKIEVEPIIDDHFKYDEDSDEKIVESTVSATPNQQTKVSLAARENVKIKRKMASSIKTKKKVEEPLREPLNNSLGITTPPKKIKKECTSPVKKEKTVEDKKSKIIVGSQTIKKEKSMEYKLVNDLVVDADEPKEEGENSEINPNGKRKYKEAKKPRMCSICSKILHNKYAVQMHEKTHIENRERKETCKVCGLKFYDKRNLYSHMRIHKENREKRHKCDFCSKAFYDKGGLNIHRRIHLGQMIPCTLCSKEYFRQVDLDRHMSSHSATTINSDTKKRSRYFVRCQHCNKSILSTSFKSHTAAHLNEPLMKCTICGKEFFRRGSCVLHVKKVHQKSNDEYNDFIAIYKKNRISHLFLEQKAEIQVNID